MHVVTNNAECHHDAHQLFLFFDPNLPISVSKSTSWTGVKSDRCRQQATNLSTVGRGYLGAHCNSRTLLRRINPRRVKIHRSYTVEEVARLFRGTQEHRARVGPKPGFL